MYTQLQQRDSEQQPVTLNTLAQMRAAGEKIACVTAYDASFAQLVEAAGVDVVLVGDSLGMVIQGHDTTVPVTMDQMVYHCAAVGRGLRRAFLVADMPFMSYTSREHALTNSVRLMQEGGARMIKLESGGSQLEIVEHLARHDIAVCAHLGLKPQSVHKTGGFRVQGREREGAVRMLAEARALEAAGADLLLLECIPASLGRDITAGVQVPVIGIGAGPARTARSWCCTTILDARRAKPRFVRNFMSGAADCGAAVARYVEAVRTRVIQRRNTVSEAAGEQAHRAIMEVVTTVAAVRERVRAWRAAGSRVALVPTMGNLHAGHLSLLAAARGRADRVITSVFVNPLQFGPAEDFAAYPRTLEEDDGCARAHCDRCSPPVAESTG
jgi:3-methyl-2-oxobutanoate hydroxymethyltransferase